MSQSNVIFGCVFLGFIVFVTMRGKLPAYLSALLGTSQAPTAAAGPGQSSAGASSPLGTAQSAIGSIAGSLK